MTERTCWHWQPGDGTTISYVCTCPPDAPGCYCDDQTEADNNFLAGWDAAINRLSLYGVLPWCEHGYLERD